jgi:hypothetical protein
VSKGAENHGVASPFNLPLHVNSYGSLHGLHIAHIYILPDYRASQLACNLENSMCDSSMDIDIIHQHCFVSYLNLGLRSMSLGRAKSVCPSCPSVFECH